MPPSDDAVRDDGETLRGVPVTRLGPWPTTTKIDTAYNAALVRAKILDPDVNFHTLRHTFASHYVMRGGSIVKRQAILGHASVRMTQIYARLAP